MSRDDVFEVINAIDRYKEFVPFCVKSRILPKSETSDRNESNVFYAELAAGFLKFSDSYISKVSTYGKERIEAETVDFSLFKYLKSIWTLFQNPDGSCTVNFYVDFEFNSYLYAYAANIFFLEVSKKMLKAFEIRFEKLFDSKLPQIVFNDNS